MKGYENERERVLVIWAVKIDQDISGPIITEEGNGNLLQYSFLENSISKGAWRATVMGSQRVGYDRATEHTSVIVHSPPYHVTDHCLLLSLF